MTGKRKPPRYRHWTENLMDMGALYAMLWFLLFLLLLLSLPLLSRLPFSIWDFLILISAISPFALALSLGIGLISHRLGYSTVWEALASGFRCIWRFLSPSESLQPNAHDALVLGISESGKFFALDSPSLDVHFLVDGKTRQGKSTLLASVVWQDIHRSDCSVILLDPHASLVDKLLSAGVAELAGERLVLLVADQDHIPGFNLLQPLQGESPKECALRLVECAMALWFQGQVAEAQRFQNYTFHAAWALAETGFTVLEIEPLLRFRPFRQRILSEVSDPQLQAWLRELDSEKGERIRELTESTVNRFRAFTRGLTSLIFGQPRSTFDLQGILDRGGVLLIAFPEGLMGEAGVYLSFGVILSMVDALLARRKKDSPFHSNPRLRLVADEAQAYPVPSLRRLLAERAGYGLSLLLAFQGLHQLDDWRLKSFILNNVSVRAVFSCSAEEAKLMAQEIFRPDPHLVKYQWGRNITFYSHMEQMAFWTNEVQNLPSHHFFAHVSGREPELCRTIMLPVRLNEEEVDKVKAKLARKVGRSRAEVEKELRQRLSGIYEGEKGGEDGWI